MEKIDVIIKGWEVYQNLGKNMGESCWKIRSVFFSLSSAIIAFSYTSDTKELYFLISFLSPVFFIFESGYRRLQSQFLEKSRQIEKTINDFLSEKNPPMFPNEGISTSLETPDIKSLLNLLRLKRIMFWFPYLLLMVLPFLLFYMNVSKEV